MRFTQEEKNRMSAAVQSRDSRFDGRFFVGVRTTGIYCRPICPAKPKPQNMVFFTDAMSAEKAGYRPCLRCRPEVAPFSPVWSGTDATVRRALKRIGEGALFEKSEDEFAKSFGVTARHLRRLVVSEIGMTPTQLSANLRLNFARSLVLETSIALSEVAFSSGFLSVRRFNDAFLKRFTRTPSQLRQARKGSESDGSSVTLRLSYRPPFDWQNALTYLRSHSLFGAELVEANSWHRFDRDETSQNARFISVSNNAEGNFLEVRIRGAAVSSLFAICKGVRKMFDLDSDPLTLSRTFGSSKFLKDIYEKNPGLRITRGWSAFEIAVGTILGQLVSVSHAKNLMRDVMEKYGIRFPNEASLTGDWIFPTPAKLLASGLKEIGTTTGRKNAVLELCRMICNGSINLEEEGQDFSEFRKKLSTIKGVGPWTVEYICLRAMGDTDALPAKDLIIGRALAKHPEIETESMRPWRSYLAIHLWKEFAEIYSQKKKGQKDVV